MSKVPKRQRIPGDGAFRRLPDIQESNPDVAINACLGKSPFPTEERALISARGKGSVYHCVWCDQWHLTLRGLKGARRIGPRRA